MDILYTVGPDSGHNNKELRWSLRSVAKFATNVGKVVVAGYPPDWLSENVVKLPLPRLPEEKHKYAHILRQVMTAIETGVVSGEFLLSSDDHFLVAPADMDKMPFWKKRDAIKSESEMLSFRRPLSEYKLDLLATRSLLLQGGYGIVMGNVHANVRLDPADAQEVRELVAASAIDPRLKEYGYDTTILFQNVRAKREGWTPDKWTPVQDNKVRANFDEARKERTKQLGWCSCGDQAFCDKRFTDYMEALFSEPCEYER